MPITIGPLTGRLYRVTDSLPRGFRDGLELALKRSAFRPVKPEKGEFRSMGWVNLRQVLDANLTANKVLFGDVLAVALRVDRITINQRLFRATLAQEIGKALRKRSGGKLTREQRGAIEEEVKLRLLKEQAPTMSVFEMAWNLTSGEVVFAATADRINLEFSDLFTKTFEFPLEPQFPYFRAQRWAARGKMERELLEVLPAPFSPRAPAEVLEVGAGEAE